MMMMMMLILVNILLLAALFAGAQARKPFWEEEAGIVMPGQELSVPTSDAKIVGTRWAILIAGSNGYWNYRHQADVCHAYQVLRRGGLKEENIIVFMFDDIANNPENPLPGVIINSPDRVNVYKNVPKDYTGKDVTVQNFLAALLGDKTAIHGGSGKVVNSGPEDHVFVYYSDHGGPGVLGMPNNPNLFAIDLIQTLKKKHAAAGYKEMVMYIEACESGSIFEGLLPNDLNIYVTTAANAEESSWGTYCPGMFPAPPPEFQTCLGDLYSVAWMEDSEAHNLLKETLRDQYSIVKSRTSNHNTYLSGSHVMQYGNTSMSPEKLCLYFGFDPTNVDQNIENAISSLPMGFKLFLEGKEMSGIEQRDADLLHFWTKYTRSSQNSLQKIESRKELLAVIAHRVHVDRSVKLIGEILFGADQGSIVLGSVRSEGEVLVDDWDCMKGMVRTFEASCGPLKQYGMKHMRAFANICNAGIDDTSKVRRAAEEACGNGVSHGFVATPVMEHFSA